MECAAPHLRVALERTFSVQAGKDAQVVVGMSTLGRLSGDEKQQRPAGKSID